MTERACIRPNRCSKILYLLCKPQTDCVSKKRGHSAKGGFIVVELFDPVADRIEQTRE